MSFISRITGLIAGLALILSALVFTGAAAQAAPPAPCAKQEQHLAKAEAALERVTAVFAQRQERVKNARAEVKGADNRSEKAQAKRDLKQAKAKKVKVKKIKKAQLKRVEKKQQRLDECQAGTGDVPEEEPAP